MDQQAKARFLEIVIKLETGAPTGEDVGFAKGFLSGCISPLEDVLIRAETVQSLEETHWKATEGILRRASNLIAELHGERSRKATRMRKEARDISLHALETNALRRATAREIEAVGLDAMTQLSLIREAIRHLDSSEWTKAADCMRRCWAITDKWAAYNAAHGLTS